MEVQALINVSRKFAEWVQNSGEDDDWLGTPRFLACATMSKDELESVLEEPLAEKFDADGAGMLTLVLLDQDEEYQLVVLRTWCQGFMRCSMAQVGEVLLRMGSLYPEITMVRRLETFKNPLISLDLSLEVALH